MPAPADAYGSAVWSDVPNFWARLDETIGASAADYMGGTAGTISGSPALGQSPVIQTGTSILFDGTDDLVQFADATAQRPAQITVEAWIIVDSAIANFAVVATKTLTTGWTAGWGLVWLTATGLRWWINHYTTQSASASNHIDATLTSGTVHHIVATYNGSQMRLYVDGVEAAGSPLSMTAGINYTGVGPLNIGRDPRGAFNWKGRIDEFAIYPAVLAASRVQSHYSIGSGTVLFSDMAATSEGSAATVGDLTVQVTPAQSIVDNFDDNAIDPVKWPATTNASETGQELHIGVVGPTYGEANTPGALSIRASYASVKFTQHPTGDVGDESGFSVKNSSNTSAEILFYVANQTLTAAYKDTNGSRIAVATATYNATSHRYNRIREAAGTIFLDVSVDGRSWTTFASFLWSDTGWQDALLDNVKVTIWAGNFNATSGRPDLIVDNLNLAPDIVKTAAAVAPFLGKGPKAVAFTPKAGSVSSPHLSSGARQVITVGTTLPALIYPVSASLTVRDETASLEPRVELVSIEEGP